MVMKSSLAICVALVLSATAATSESLYSFDTTPSKLPKSVIPSHYAIELAPNPQTLATAGQETVDIEVREAVSLVVLNAVNTEISDAAIDDGVQRAAVSYDPKAETATLTFPDAIAPGLHKLRLDFT